MKRLLAVWVTILVLSLLGNAAYAAPQPGSKAPTKPHTISADDSAESTISGKVVETMSAAGYTYVLLENKGKKTWVAVSEMKITVGQDMAFQHPGTPMNNFTSKSLNRTFDVIYFSGGPVSAGKTSSDVSPGSTAPAKPHTVSADDSAESSLSGKVVETMNAAGYTYVLLEKKGKKTWVAVSEMKVTVGQEMAFLPGAPMTRLHEQKPEPHLRYDLLLGRAGHFVLRRQDVLGASPGSKAAVSAADKDIKVEKAAGANAYTVAEIYQKAAALNGKTVVVKGKVVKVSAGIMGKNWIHLQDGTGDAENGSHNLVATSDDLPAKGDVVTMKGTIIKDKDFGSGYKYSVIMEKGEHSALSG